MNLNVDVAGKYASHNIDIDGLYKPSWVISEDDLVDALTAAIAQVALEEEVSFDSITPDYIDQGGDELSVTDNGDGAWIREICKFWFFLNGQWGKDKYWAYIECVGWSYFDFENLDLIDDKSVYEYEDKEDFAREWMENSGEDLPDHLEGYFDYESYADYILDGYDTVEWDGQMYAFSR